MIIGVLNQNGGTGKTTVAVNLATVLGQAPNFRVLLVDADPQGSALAWSSAREQDPLFPVVGMAKRTLHKELPELALDYDAVVIDGAPRVNELGRAVIMASDLIAIPVQPSLDDVRAAAETVALIKETQQLRHKLEAVFAINRKIVNTTIGRDVVRALVEFGFPVSEHALHQRAVYAESAAREVARLAKFLIRRMQVTAAVAA